MNSAGPKPCRWIRSLTRRSIGQLWMHHTGHDESRGYGSKTRVWQMDAAAHCEKIERPDTDVSFKLHFTKARERSPQTRADFADVIITLLDNHWTGDLTASTTIKAGKVSPLGLKFFEALKATRGAKTVGSVTMDDWQTSCTKRGLIDPKEKPDAARSLFSKHRRELIAANKVACNETTAWIVAPELNLGEAADAPSKQSITQEADAALDGAHDPIGS
jgi:hypothetical protein